MVFKLIKKLIRYVRKFKNFKSYYIFLKKWFIFVLECEFCKYRNKYWWECWLN